jgi:hypothetical protein
MHDRGEIARFFLSAADDGHGALGRLLGTNLPRCCREGNSPWTLKSF